MTDSDSAQQDLIFHKAADTGRLHAEMLDSQSVRLKEALAFRASQEVLALVASLKCEGSHVISQTIELAESEKGLNGKVSYAVSTIHGGDTRLVTIPVMVKEGAVTVPEAIVVESILNSAKGMQKTAALNLRNEVDEFISNRTAVVEPELTKVASAGPSAPCSNMASVINCDKTWLPSDLKVGDTLFIGSAKYKVTNGSIGKLSSDSDGSFWTLSLVSEMADPKENLVTIL